MKQTILLLLSVVFLASCSSDTNSNDDNFFNLETGDIRVYKRFNSNDGVAFTATERIDSVFTTGDSLISGVNYEKFVHKVYNSGVYAPDQSFTETLREDQNGHLVNSSGFVFHPGLDATYTQMRQYHIGESLLGNINYYSESPVTINIEGENYFIYPFIGHYVPINSGEQEQFTFDYYKKGLGLVNQHCSAVSGTSCYEDRLIHHDLN